MAAHAKRLSERRTQTNLLSRLYQIGGSHAQRHLSRVYLDAWLRAELENNALHLLKSALQPVVIPFALPPLLPTANPALLVSVAPVQEYAPNRSSIAEQTS